MVLSEEGGTYQAFSDSLRSKLHADKVILKTQIFDEPISVSDLYIAVGMKAATELAGRDIPLLSVLVPKAAYDSLPRGSVHRTAQHSVIFLDQPMERQVALLQAALPDTRRVGVIYSFPPPELNVLRKLLADRNIRLYERSVNETQTLNDALETVLSESEVLFVLADAKIYNAGTIRNILLTAYRKQVPLIGISQAYVRAGALCAIYSTPAQIAAQAAEAVMQFAATTRMPPGRYPQQFEVSVNRQVARSLDIPIKDADRLRNEIRRNP
jgi:putative ABC transport system substrate-binding protein